MNRTKSFFFIIILNNFVEKVSLAGLALCVYAYVLKHYN